MHRIVLSFTLAAGSLFAQNNLVRPVEPGSVPSFTLEERWKHYVYRTYSPQRMALLALDTTIDGSMSPGRCGRKLECFPDRFTGAFLRRSTRTTIEFGAGLLLHEDIRRRPSGLDGFGERLKYSLVHAFSSRGPNGEWKPAYSRFAGAAGGIAVGAVWSHHPMSASHFTHAMSWALASNLQDALLCEFEADFRRIGKRFQPKWLGGKR